MGVAVLRAAKGKDSSLPGTHSPLESADFARGVGPHIEVTIFIFVQFLTCFVEVNAARVTFPSSTPIQEELLFDIRGLL